jgi:hypothetical protein
MNDTPSLLHNFAKGSNHQLKLNLVGVRSNRNGIGARVTVDVGGRRLIDEVQTGGSFCSQNDLSLFFGLGARQQADSVRVQWPSGGVDVFKAIPADRCVTLKEGDQRPSIQEFSAYPKP